MEVAQRVVDVMDKQLTHKLVFRSWKSDRHRNNRLQSHIIVEEPQQEQQWQESIDPLKLVLGKVIARGTFGVVHKGSYQGQTVAVKVLDKGTTGATMEMIKKDFMKEVHVWQNLDHPNITKMIGATMSMMTECWQKSKKPRTKSSYCMVAEYIKGGSLRSYLSNNRFKKLPFKTVVLFALDIAKGLSYLHSKKIIHRDVKPENMLIDKQSTIKLTDFGESIFEPLDLIWISGESGTRGYMAPEVVSGKLHGHKCDVYSFGICLWEIYSCEMAYTYSLDNITADIYKDMRPSIPITCPRSLARLMERCWDTDPRKRPEMKDVVLELEEIGKSNGCQSALKDPQPLPGCFALFGHRS